MAGILLKLIITLRSELYKVIVLSQELITIALVRPQHFKSHKIEENLVIGIPNDEQTMSWK